VGLQGLRDTLKRHGLRLSRDLGQNFLVEDAVAERLALLSGVEANDAVIEIGTGLGVLTRALARRSTRVVTLEIDSGLVRALRSDGSLPSNVELVHADALRVDLRELAERLVAEPGAAAGRRKLRVVANLPYSAASPLLRRLLDLRDVLTDWSVMLQRELADRLVAAPGSGDYGSLTVLHRLAAVVTREMDLKPGCFFPAPNVESSFVRVLPRQDSPLGADELARVEQVVRAVFNQRRKTILNGLRGGRLAVSGERETLLAALAVAGVDPRSRAETLAPETLLALARALPDARA
jgi:16S rRNA (adenine1518-N6/adenine1519-N6)-dimethyltransferase